MPNKKFLENYPLLRKWPFEVSIYRDAIKYLPQPAINMFCRQCNSLQTFNMSNDFAENFESSDVLIWNKTLRTVYLCSACNSYEYVFFIEFVRTGQKDKDSNYIGHMRKIGQNPPWEIEMDFELQNLLGNYSDIYKKGLVCESQGYGIGAYAYFRRIVEEIIGTLLISIGDLIESDREKKKYLIALDKTKKAKNAEEKIRLVKELLPASLRPDNLNPLGILYSSLSEGLHNKTDEECLDLVDSLKTALIYLIHQIFAQQKTKKEFTESIRKILEKTNNKS